ncbi:Metallo-dependent phosphatase-like protein [Aspergillus cavernicola]|uniref:Metallo-dependent phosphatase-like protein n=1 Tax=Aspergillus cavernicola TaxID=176166 RepID=A0ABR4IE89_9EURO
MRLGKTRFVCVSDTHGYTPSEAGFRFPAGDVLIHAGDLTNQGSKSELRKTIDWIAAADYEVKIVVCGNHDITLDEPFYRENKAHFHNRHPQDPRECMELITHASPSIIFLKHESALIRLTNPNGPNTVFKVFGSPYSQCNGNWAFLYESDKAEELWRAIPLDTDIVVTHMPPRSHCDNIAGAAMGCQALQRNLERVRPSLAVCGHIHESRGYERVKWRSLLNPKGDEGESLENEAVKGVLPPLGSKKQSLVDLTGKKAPRLDNQGFFMRMGENVSSFSPPALNQDIVILPQQSNEVDQGQETGFSLSPSCPTTAQAQDARADAECVRTHRQETCIVNAAIMATNWPHQGGRKFYPGPIVVDLELPVWTNGTPSSQAQIST